MKMQLVIEAKFLLGDMTKKDMEERAALLVRWVMKNNMFTNETPAKVAAWKVGFIRDGGEVDSVDGEIDMETFIEYHTLLYDIQNELSKVESILNNTADEG